MDILINTNPLQKLPECPLEDIEISLMDAARLLSNAHPKEIAPLGHDFFQNSFTFWAQKSIKHYNWLLMYAWGLCNKFQDLHQKKHWLEPTIEWLTDNLPVFQSE